MKRLLSAAVVAALLLAGGRADATYVNKFENNTAASTCTVTLSGISAGDFLILEAITDSSNANDFNTPAGWTLAFQSNTTTDNASFAVFYKKAAGGETSVSVSTVSTNTAICGVGQFNGIDGSTQLDVAAVTFSSSSTGTTMDMSITPVTNGAELVYVCGYDGATGNYTFTYSTTAGTTGAWSTRVDQWDGGFRNVSMGEATQTTAGAITARCASSTTGGRMGVLFALRPAATATLDQESFRFGVDDANEAGHTWEAAQDTSITAAAATKLLRAQVDATGDPPSTAYTLYAQKNGSGGYAKVNVGSTTKITPVIDSGDATTSGNNTASSSWAVSHPAAATGDLLIFYLAWDDSTNTTGVTPPSGPNGETLTAINSTPVTDSNTETRGKAWYTVATGSWSASTRTFTPSASEQWQATVIKVLAGEFDSVTPIGASGTAAATGLADTASLSPAYSVGASDGSGTLVWCTSVDADALATLDNGWTQVANVRLSTTISNGVAVRDTAVANSEAVSAASWTIASDSWTSLAFVVRAPTVTNQVYVDASANITAGGEATTARLTAPSGKSTSDFVTGRRWDDENGTDTVDVTTDDYTEVEWAVALAGSLSNGDYYEFRVYKGAAALDTYTATPKWTVGGGGAPSFVPAIINNPIVGMLTTTKEK